MIKLSFLNLFRRKTRTALALLGIMIGVASIIVLVSIVDGLLIEFTEVMSQYEGLMIMEKDAVDQPFSFLDESLGEELEQISGVNLAIPEIWYLPKKVDGESISLASLEVVSVYGLDVQKNRLAKQSGWIGEVETGKILSGNDEGYVLIGKRLSKNFKKFVGSQIEIDDKKFIVKGIFEGSSMLLEGMIVMNLSDGKELSGIKSSQVNGFTVDLVDPTKSEQVKTLIEFKYPDELQVYSAASISDQFGGIMDQFRLLVFFVAAISGIVAGVGIANTILMSIRERIKEIGTLKAVGWTNSDIVKMILYESFFVGVIGGVLGILLGYFIDIMLKQFLGLNFAITLELIVQAFVFAVGLGLIAGVYPAFKASKLDPVVALRGG